MRWLLFLSRLAFICGVFFVLSISLLLYDWTYNQDIIGTIIIGGYFMGMIIVPATIICYLFVLLIKKKLKGYVPLWLVYGNIIFLFIFLYYLFYLNDHYHP